MSAIKRLAFGSVVMVMLVRGHGVKAQSYYGEQTCWGDFTMREEYADRQNYGWFQRALVYFDNWSLLVVCENNGNGGR
jgi:hypothetical protein